MLIFMNIISKKETFYNYIHLWYHLSINKNELFESQVVYSETLDQYICHKAIDISAPAGSPVSAVMAGTVTEVGKDDKYGPYVTVTHGNGVESRYCCLGETEVSEGDVVSKGDKIGVVGEEALFEKAEGPHLHFEVLKDGTLINPDEITK